MVVAHGEDDGQRLGADEVVISKNAAEVQKHADSFDFMLDTVSGEHDINSYLQLLKLNGTNDAGWRSRETESNCFVQFDYEAPLPWPDPASAASAKPSRCSTSAANMASPPTSK